jgi:hypothetical protein
LAKQERLPDAQANLAGVPQSRGTTPYRTFTQVLALIGSLGLCACNQPGRRDDDG